MSSFRAAAPANELRVSRPGDSPGQSDSAGRGGAGRRRAAARARRVLRQLREALGAGSGAGTWAAQVLARSLLGSSSLAADVAPGPARVLVRVPAVAVVAGA